MTTQVKLQKMFLAGEWVSRSHTIDVFNPQNSEMIASVPAASREDMLLTIEKAKKGTQMASNMPAHQRMTIIHHAADYIEARRDRYAQTIATESSKTIREATGEVKRCIETLRLSAEEARRITGETINFDQAEGSEHRVGYYYRFPIGVIGAITPFNDPLNLVAHKVGPAIAAGNAIVVKPASVTPLSALLLAEAFEKAGLAKGILSVVTGSGGEIGDTLITHPDVKMISFTGGLETGRTIAHKAGLKKVSMELGSNSPVIILEDADLDKAIEACISGGFSAAGQNCIGVQRILVETPVYERFVEQYAQEVSRLTVGDKFSEWTDVGPMINEQEAKRVENWVNRAVYRGATLLTGGRRERAFYYPTVLTDVPKDATLTREEIFGPVVLIYPVPDLSHAVDLANDVDYGLQAGIFTQNLDKVFRTIRTIDAGGIMINDSSDYRIDGMPFGGVKGSGLGREGVKYAIEAMTEPKVVCFNLNDRLASE
ncbi:aldehyde dehydrogenase family protein [Tuberibacillus sp. Marseille-P3662]|uniref:aldehyde dehydrogenase family protein n=1 Tax=Tuberibacillus sp. Marseille-P3662 TaxID=1965358 RepID=UPI000A1CDFBA|nr:aldehyde dehydrogenase family protein [Tuberibacillus sp. Marseille-P3662]